MAKKASKAKSRKAKKTTRTSRTRIVQDLDRKILDLAARQYGKLRRKFKIRPSRSKHDLVLALGEKVLDRVRAFRRQPEGKPAERN